MSEIADTATYPIARRVRVIQRLLRLLPIVVTVALLALLFRASSGEKLLDLWRHFDVGWMVASTGLFALSIAGGAVALLVLFELRGRLAWWARFTVDYFYVQALSQLTPAQAGEIALPYVAGRGRFAPGEIAASLVIQRMTTLAIVVLFALAGAGRWANPAMLWGAAALVLFFCLAGIAAIRNSTIRNWLNALVNRRFGPILYGFYATWTSVFRDRRRRLLLHIVVMIARFVVGVAAGYSVLRAFGVVVPFWDLAALTAWTTLAVLVPISINGVGVTEGIFVAALAGYGNGTEQVLTACLAGRLVSILTLLAGSAAFWLLRWSDRRAVALP